MNTREQICPNHMLLLGKNNLLVIGRILLRGVNVLFSNIPCIGWRVLICGHTLTFLKNGYLRTQNINNLFNDCKRILSLPKMQVKNSKRQSSKARIAPRNERMIKSPSDERVFERENHLGHRRRAAAGQDLCAGMCPGRC